MIPTIRLNGNVFTRKSTAVRINGVYRLNGIDSMEWSDELPAELVSAMNEGGVPLGKAIGNYTCAASMSVYLDECAAFEAGIMALSPIAIAEGRLGAAVFQIAVITREEVRTRTVVLVNCNITGKSDSIAADGSARVKQYTLQPTVVIEDGLSLVRLTPAL